MIGELFKLGLKLMGTFWCVNRCECNRASVCQGPKQICYSGLSFPIIVPFFEGIIYLNMWVLILTMLINSTFACLTIAAPTQRLTVPAQSYEHCTSSLWGDKTSQKWYICPILEFHFDAVSQNLLGHGQQDHVPIPRCLQYLAWSVR